MQPDAVPIPSRATASIEIVRKSLLWAIFKWLILLVLLVTVLILLWWLVKGETPAQMLSTWRDRNYLEGEMELLHPRPANAEDCFIGLPGFQSRSILIRNILPDDAASDGSDAELETVVKGGIKLVRLNRTEGVVRVNDNEVASVDLYDGDEIELGEIRLRFNRVGYERPTEMETEL